MKLSKGSKWATVLYLLILALVCFLWAKELMADQVWRFWYSEIRGNDRICYYLGPNAPTLIVGVTERCPKTL